MRNQSRGLKVVDGWIEGTNSWKDQGVDCVEVLWTAHENGFFTKPFQGFPHGVEIAHAVIDYTKVQAQSINPFERRMPQRYFEIVPERVALGTAPTTVSTFWPPLNTISVGMLRMPYWLATFGFSSVLSLNTLI